MTMNVSSMDPTSVTLTSLIPFTNYTISVSLFNVVGTGDPMTIQVQTRSRREFTYPLNHCMDIRTYMNSHKMFKLIFSPLPPELAAPQNVTISAQSSTALQIIWDVSVTGC